MRIPFCAFNSTGQNVLHQNSFPDTVFQNAEKFYQSKMNTVSISLITLMHIMSEGVINSSLVCLSLVYRQKVLTLFL